MDRRDFYDFTIVEVKRTSPVTYRIADLNGGEITGTFY